MPPVDTQALFTVLDVLEEVPQRFVLLGGAVVELLVDDPDLIDFRPTKDVDALFEVLNRSAYTRLEKALRRLGCRPDITEGAPICRWVVNNSVKLDVLPPDETVLGFSSNWFRGVLNHAMTVKMEGRAFEVVSPVYLIATKLAAFESRGKGDFFGSHDLEDIITVLDGRAEIVNEIQKADASVRSYISSCFSRYVNDHDLLDILWIPARPVRSACRDFRKKSAPLPPLSNVSGGRLTSASSSSNNNAAPKLRGRPTVATRNNCRPGTLAGRFQALEIFDGINRIYRISFPNIGSVICLFASIYFENRHSLSCGSTLFFRLTNKPGKFLNNLAGGGRFWHEGRHESKKFYSKGRHCCGTGFNRM